jgi:ElaB/YqjD/DUF883 family membrane-anchored ribosome-binding protein
VAQRRLCADSQGHQVDAELGQAAGVAETSLGAIAHAALERLRISGTPFLGHRGRIKGRQLESAHLDGTPERFGATWRSAIIPAERHIGLAPSGRCAHCLEMTMTAAKFERSREALVKDFTDVLAEAESLLKQAAKESGEKANDLRGQVEAKLRSAKIRLNDLSDDASERAKAAAKVTDDYVRDNPWQAIGIAAAVGFLAGLALSRR